MINIFKQAAKITNYNIILAIPLIVFVKLLDLYSLYSRNTVDSTHELILASVTVLFMSGAFFASWFYMVKEAIDLSKQVFVLDADRAKATMNLFKALPVGIGKYFLSFVGFYIILFFIQVFATPVVYLLGVNIIGGLDTESMQNLQVIAMDPSITNQSMAAFIDKLAPEQIIFFGKWSLLFMLITSIIMYLLMFWIPEIIYKTPNPLVALWRSVVKLFKDFFSSFRFFISIWLMGFALLFLNTFAVINPLAYIIMNIILFYFTVFVVVAIFLYYDKKFVDMEAVDDESKEK
ncbi:unknown [Clostridium sp. CAG:729]|nr:unknown [Clostridium sp. CAG:729]